MHTSQLFSRIFLDDMTPRTGYYLGLSRFEATAAVLSKQLLHICEVFRGVCLKLAENQCEGGDDFKLR